MTATFSGLTGLVLRHMNKAKLEAVDAVPTPLPAWNNYCRDEGGGVGVAQGWHVVIAGNTGLGKSLLALNLAGEAIRHGIKVGYVSLEMSEIQLATRLQAIVAGVNIRTLEHGQDFNLDEANKAADSVEAIRKDTGGCVLTNDEPVYDLDGITEAFELMATDYGVRYFITDYMQLAWVNDASSLLKQITEVSHRIRHLARTLRVVSIGVSQLNRSVAATRESPISQGLYGGGPLENDADQVLIFDHTTYTRVNDLSATVDLLLTKNRHGATGKIPCRWDYRTLRLLETDTVHNDYPPF